MQYCLSDAIYQAHKFSVENSRVTVVIDRGGGDKDFYWSEVDKTNLSEIQKLNTVVYYNIHFFKSR